MFHVLHAYRNIYLYIHKTYSDSQLICRPDNSNTIFYFEIKYSQTYVTIRSRDQRGGGAKKFPPPIHAQILRDKSLRVDNSLINTNNLCSFKFKFSKQKLVFEIQSKIIFLFKFFKLFTQVGGGVTETWIDERRTLIFISAEDVAEKINDGIFSTWADSIRNVYFRRLEVG